MADSKIMAPTAFIVPPRKDAETPLLDVGHLLRSLRSRWLGTLITVLLVCGGVGFLLLRRPAVYAANTMLLIERSTDRVVDIKQVVDNTVESSLTDALLLTHIQQIKSHGFISHVAASLSPEEEARIRAPYRTRNPGTGEAPRQVISVEEIIQDGLKVERSGRTLLIMVSARHHDPAAAQLIANRVAEQYIVHLLERSSASNDSALSFLKRQVDELRTKLEAADKKAQAYREQHNLVFLDQDQNMGADRLRTLSTSATQARVARLALDARLAQIEVILKGDGGIRQLSSVTEFAAYANVQKQIDELQAKRDVLAERYGRQHPLMLENTGALQTLERLRLQQVNAAVSDLRNQREKALVEENQLRVELASAEKESLQREQLASAYNVLRREVDTTRETYSQILARLNETTISSRLQNTNVKLVGRAAMPVRPVEPDRLKVIAILGMLGAFVIIGYPWAAERRNRRIHGCSDAETCLGGTVIGELPLVSRIPELQRGMIVARATDENMIEAFRGIYSQFRLSGKRDPARSVLVTSTIPGEGKSFVAANLAATFAAHGMRVLLIDADLRRPTLHKLFGLGNENGLLTWQAARQTIRDPAVLRAALGIKTVSPQLSLLRAGGVSTRLTEILGTAPVRELLDELQQQYDLIVIDSSPAGVFPDAEAFSALVEDLLFVCRYDGANRDHARETLARLSRTDMALRGIIINGIPRGHASSYYASSYAQGAGHYRKAYSGPRS